MSRNDYFSRKKTRVSFMMAVLVLILHLYVFPHYPLEGDPVGDGILLVNRYLRDFIEFAVPLFFILSGALFFRNYSYDKTLEKWKSRIFSLVIPYLIWNTVNMGFELICSYTPISNYMLNRPKVALTVGNLLRGFFLCEYNGPFWFVLDLIIFALFCPLVYFLVREKRRGAVSIAVISLLYYVGIGLPESLFRRADSIIYYLIGAYIGIHFFPWLAGRMARTPRNVVLAWGLLTVATAALSVVCRVESPWVNRLAPVLILCMSLSFWRACDCFAFERIYAFEHESFLIYAIHQNLIAVISKLFFLVLPVTIWASLVNWVGTTVISVVLICLFAYVVGRISPRLKRILGGR